LSSFQNHNPQITTHKRSFFSVKKKRGFFFSQIFFLDTYMTLPPQRQYSPSVVPYFHTRAGSPFHTLSLTLSSFSLPHMLSTVGTLVTLTSLWH